MPPCDLLAITAWEQRYSTQLPEVNITKNWELEQKVTQFKVAQNSILEVLEVSVYV